MPEKEKDKSYFIEVNEEISLKLWHLDPGFYFHADLVFPPDQKREDLFIYLMRANLLGQGTDGARIGLDAEEKSLTLSYELPYAPKYEEFKDKIEDFINFVSYWKDEIQKHKQQMNETIL